MNPMMTRRAILTASGKLALLGAMVNAGLITAAQAAEAEWNEAAFEATTMEEFMKAIGASDMPVDSTEVRLEAPDIPESGATVPVTLICGLPGTTALGVLVDKNPNLLAAWCELPEGTEANVSLRIKMNETSDVRVLARAGNTLYMTSKEIKVTLGGCGG